MKGTSVSSGLAVAKPFILQPQTLEVPKTTLPPGALEGEKQRFFGAVGQVRGQLTALLEGRGQTFTEEEKTILGVHISLLDDPTLIDETVGVMEERGFGAAYALQCNMEQIAEELADLDDEYIRERVADIQNVANLLLRALLGVSGPELDRLDGDCILVCEELEPSQLLAADRRHLKGLVCERGGGTSHVAILCRNLGLPAVFGVQGAIGACRAAGLMILDGGAGTLILDPAPEQAAEAQKKIRAAAALRRELMAFAGAEGRTRDGARVEVCANIGHPDEAKDALQNGAEGVGLFRTEFLYMQAGRAPTEAEQLESYKAAALAMEGRPVIIRTLDAGGDKEIGYLDLPREANPFLGFRAIRVCLARPQLFKTQLRAILRAGAYGDVRIMYPMISSLREYRAANALLEEAKAELRAEGLPFREDIPTGIMIEIPAAAVCADQLAAEVDFFSIGTNDLIQYTTAVDRTSPTIADLYDDCSPGVLRLIRHTIESARRASKPVGMCGEMAGNLLFTPLLAGMGIDELSASAQAAVRLKKALSLIELPAARQLVQEVMQLDTGEQIRARLQRAAEEWGLAPLLSL